MAPKRKLTNPKESAAAAAPVLRRSSRLSTAAVAPPAADPEPPKKKKTKTKTTAEHDGEAEAKPKPKPKPAPSLAVEKEEAVKTIVIEHCKQCHQFKKRAIQVKDALEKDVAGVNVVVNREKPRRGCFEIREEGGEVFVSLLDLKRPFPPLRALNMDKLISDIVEKIR